ncbi:hypothetical protein J3458_019556 [Metarhizium acridum]|uniref:uncharacterized protein n=1 Tax=Metarhizium acridum TaxID=92637 RepID=UPI001C6CC27C|nr:hypothetical protein J3458_019556 [Metarhizium acridum]
MQRTASRLVKYVGSTPIGSLPAKYASTVEVASEAIESEVSTRHHSFSCCCILSLNNQNPKVVEAKIQGSCPHKSSKDRDDNKDVITVSYHTATGTRVISIHAHDDLTWNEFPSRNAFKGK